MTNERPAAVRLLPGERVSMRRINGLNLCLREWGDPAALPVVMLHGLRGFSGTWRTLAARLQDRYRLVAVDQRGRGDSDWDPAYNYYTDAYLADLEALVDDLGLKHFVLIGHSMGGTTSYVYADRHPDRVASLVIEDIAPGASVSGAGAARVVGELAALPPRFESWREAREYWRRARPSVTAEAIEQRVAESLREDADGHVVWRYDAEGIRRTRVSPDPARVVDLWPVVERLAVRTLIIRGEASDFCPAESVARMCASNPRVSSVTIPGATHYVHDDAPVQFANEVEAFLAPLRGRAALS
jgi:pimeloyl-ACP methyl ester carboxylesterase